MTTYRASHARYYERNKDACSQKRKAKYLSKKYGLPIALCEKQREHIKSNGKVLTAIMSINADVLRSFLRIHRPAVIQN